MKGLKKRPGAGGATASESAFKQQLNKVYRWYTLAFFMFVVVLAVLEQAGLPREWIGFIFLFATIGLYAAIGIMSRTTDATEYYVAGRRVPAVYNGMATGADWMSAASFIGLAGTLYLTGYSGLAFILGWTGGYCLVALLLAPYLRKFGQFTIPDFLGERYGGHLPRLLGVMAAILVSFIYVVAQIYGVGLITSRLVGVAFELGIFLGLGGILVCSFLGGMRAVTWTQVAQYIVIIVAYLIPVVWLSVKQTGVPVPQVVYGYQLEKVTAKEKELASDPKELEVRQIFASLSQELAEKLKDPAAALMNDKAKAEARLAALRQADASFADLSAAEKTLSSLPRTATAAESTWSRRKAAADTKSQPLNGMPPHAAQFAGDPDGDPEAQQTYDESRRNFLALAFCLMVGTAALPHILMRYYTVPSVKAARESVTWSLFFIFLLYFTAPALAVMVKFEVFNVLIGTPFDQLPAWVAAWNKVDPSLLSVTDVNQDGLLQLNEMSIGGDIIVLATAEIAGLPYVISGLVAAGGLAAALSTADGLLLTIANALSHDVYYKMIDPNASTARRVTISKVLLLMVALAAAYVAAQKPADILFLVSAAFSLAASAFFPALVLGIFWKRATGIAASLGMICGLAITFYYMVTTQPWLRDIFGVTRPVELWWGIQPISAGVFGVPLGFAVIVLISWITPAPGREVEELVEHVRYPRRQRV
ncbi:cation acetate symporter [Hydrogenophaga crassostreae]|uniref:Cation acetate symporter n=1 Tax=Hydrogenophaga crassostreae TaxID=1763535 RepID=A0A162W5A8_9BURK|nr:sodium:solute symporter family protein [Hydrogenophaga crassostreae]AOW14072.1 cation acetate symporter [Hydrogenophaga crassostreae]OAD43966.1 cation acetate symporter [Hydrogenophaga crassostreae]